MSSYYSVPERYKTFSEVRLSIRLFFCCLDCVIITSITYDTDLYKTFCSTFVPNALMLLFNGSLLLTATVQSDLAIPSTQGKQKLVRTNQVKWK